ncbi:MAG TPA: (2Fe-2S)-binding protein [bacterium]|nr:(2Fe-2S)-binding protein [bacterium]
MTDLTVALTLNGRPREVRTSAHRTLLEILRDDLGAMEVKEGCGEGVCGTCTVLLDGEPVSSCLVLAPRAAGCQVTTVRGLGDGDRLHPLQEAFVTEGGIQCGFCIPGMILTAYAFLRDHPAASRAEIRRALAGNLCRCTGYTKIIDAIASVVPGRGAGEQGAGGG